MALSLYAIGWWLSPAVTRTTPRGTEFPANPHLADLTRAASIPATSQNAFSVRAALVSIISTGAGPCARRGHHGAAYCGPLRGGPGSRGDLMFFTYLRRELRRRMRQAIFISVGLALGIGLVITVTAASSGVKAAQGTVLQNLDGVGTSRTVPMPPSARSVAPAGPHCNFHPAR